MVLATWGERKIVLKTTKLSTTLNASIGHYSSLSVKDFWKKVFEEQMHKGRLIMLGVVYT